MVVQITQFLLDILCLHFHSGLLTRRVVLRPPSWEDIIPFLLEDPNESEDTRY